MKHTPCLIALLVVAGCSSPPVRTYLLPTPAPATAHNRAILVGPLRLPAHLSRSEVAWRDGQNTLNFDEFSRWGTTFDIEALRALAAQLSQAAGTQNVVTWPAQQGAPDTLRITVDIEQLDVTSAGPCQLRARYLVHQGTDDALVASGITEARTTLDGEPPAAAVVAYGQLIADLAQDIARHLP